MERGAWWIAVRGVTKSQTRLSDFHFRRDLHLSNRGVLISEIFWLPETNEILAVKRSNSVS